MGLKILYRNPRRPGEAGVKLVPDQSQEAGRKGDPGRIGLHRNRDDAGAILSEAPHSAGTLSGTSESKMNEFGRLLEKEIPRLRRYAFALTRNMSRADDLVQDTLVRAIAKQRGWQCGTNLRAWLFTLMHNQNVNGVRRSPREGAVEFDDTWPFPTAATDPAAGLSLRDLDRALAQIPEERRQGILLIGLEDISYKEAATILDVPIGTIRSRLSRGRESLRMLMDRTHATEPVNRAAITSAPSKPKRFVPGFERTQNS